MKVLINGKVCYMQPCVSCGKPRDVRSKSGKCWRCFVGHPALIRTAPNVYRRPCPKCDRLMDPSASLCSSCEMRRRIREGIVKPGNDAAQTLERDSRGWWKKREPQP